MLQGMELAKGLISLGIKRGDAVLSVGVDGPNSMILFIATSSIGAIFSVSACSPPYLANVYYFITPHPVNILTEVH